MAYEHFLVTVTDKIAHVAINRPQKVNALHLPAWEELKAVMEELSNRVDVRVVVLSGEGKLFCAGIDLELLMSVKELEKLPSREECEQTLYGLVIKLQNCVSAIERCTKPVIAAIHNGCIGGGVDIIAACDLRYCTDDAYFTIKEIDMGMVADLGTLQRLPKFVRPAVVAEMAFTGRAVNAAEALESGLVNGRFSTKDALMDGVLTVARQIASKSPISIRGTKVILQHTRDHSVDTALEFMARWNSTHLLSEDLTETFRALMQKGQPVYKDS